MVYDRAGDVDKFSSENFCLEVPHFHATVTEKLKLKKYFMSTI